MQKKLLRGFTLIELIITITILSILAVALLAALDPMEQINRARDTGVRNTALELHNALQRYYAIANTFPADFCGTDPDNGACISGNAVAAGGTPASTGNIISDLSDAGELKSNFARAAGNRLNQIRLFAENGTTNIYTCFTPVSKGFQRDPNNIWVISGNPPSAPDNIPSAGESYCIQ